MVGATSVEIGYVFRGAPDVAPSLAFLATTVDGAMIDPATLPTVTATPEVASFSDWIITEEHIYRGVFGLGVTWAGLNPERVWGWVGPNWWNCGWTSVLIPVFDTDWNEIDDSGPDGTLHLTFTDFGWAHDVGVELAYVSLIGGNDDVSTWHDGIHVDTFDPPNGAGPQRIDLTGHGISLFENDVLSFTVAGRNDDIAVAGIVLSAMTPEPGTLALMAFGMLALGYGVRRRRRA